MRKALYVIMPNSLKKGEMSDIIPYRQSVNDADKVKTGLYRYKKAVMKKEKGQMQFPTDDDDKACIAKKKKSCIKQIK